MDNPAPKPFLKIKPDRPTIFVSVAGLLPNVALVVAAVKPPLPGQANPEFEDLSVLWENTPLSDAIAIPVVKDARGKATGFAAAGLQFTATFLDDDVIGTVTIRIMRDQDTPTAPPFDRPVSVTVPFSRSEGGPMFIEVQIPLHEDV
jgi:hypothetical protein